MNFIDQAEEGFVKKINSQKNDVLNNNKIILTKFLNLREQELYKFVIGKSLNLYFSNVSQQDESKRALLSSFELTPDFNISILKLDYNKKYLEINHRMILGNIMSLQIERNMIGDILISDKSCYIIVSKEIKDVIINEIKSINHTPVSFIEVDSIEGDFSPKLKEKKLFLSSLRIDLVLANAYNISRNEIQEIIDKKDVKINQRVITNHITEVKENDIISLAHHGRIKILNIGSLSRSGKIIVDIGEYV